MLHIRGFGCRFCQALPLVCALGYSPPLYTHRNSKFRLSENILGPYLKVAQSANPRNTPVLLAVGLNHNFQI